MRAKAVVRDEWERQGVRLLVGITGPTGDITHTLRWGDSVSEPVSERVDVRNEEGLLLSNDVARAVYEALAEHFGHTGNDVSALRRDYEAERARVDKFITHAIGAT